MLRWVLDFHPRITYTRRELLLELSGAGAPGYFGSDAGERALRELVRRWYCCFNFIALLSRSLMPRKLSAMSSS